MIVRDPRRSHDGELADVYLQVIYDKDSDDAWVSGLATKEMVEEADEIHFQTEEYSKYIIDHDDLRSIDRLRKQVDHYVLEEPDWAHWYGHRPRP